jgi:hypothetical protein
MESMDLGISAVLDQVFSVFSRSDFENFENPFDDLKRAAWSRQRLTISSSTGARRSSRHLLCASSSSRFRFFSLLSS